MKHLLLITLLSLAFTTNAAIVCKKDGRYWYPNNEKSKKIALMLGVKTCNGKRFKAVVKGLGEKSNVIAGKKSMKIADILKAMK